MSNTLRVQTYHIIVDAPAESLFDFVDDLENLPQWAFHFCKGIRMIPDGAMVTSPSGEVYFGIAGRRELGILDWWSGPTVDSAQMWPTRITTLPDGRSLYTVTAIFGNPVPPNIDALFADELGALKRLVEAKQAVLA